MKKIKFLNLVLYTALSLIYSSCNNDDDTDAIPGAFNPISDIASFHGNFDANIVVVHAQGGPGIELVADGVVDQFISGSETGSALFAVVQQAQTQNSSNFINADITFEEAKQFDLESVANLKRVVDFFKIQQGKTVYISGISFGSFIVQELIASYGVDVADGYLIMVGRLNIEAQTWQSLSEGRFVAYQYENNGTFTLNDFGEEPDFESRNMSKLAAGLGFNRYVTRMDAINDLSKITYVYGDRDEAVGPLSNEELQFLNDRNSNVVLVENGTHDATIQMGLDILKVTFGIQ